MKSLVNIGGVTVALVSAAMVGIAGAGADTTDYTVLVIDPNTVADTLAYTAGAPTLNPGGQPGASVIFTHRDGRSITDTVWVLPDASAAVAAVSAATGNVALTNPKSQSVPVGTGGQLLSGTTPDGASSVSLLSFTQGNAAATLRFSGPANDPVPMDVAVELGQAQDALIKKQLGMQG